MDLPPGEALRELGRIGWLPGLDAAGVLGEVDPDPEHEPGRPLGVEVRRNPFAALRDDDELWAVWDGWRLGYRATPDPRELVELSAFHVECLRELRNARARHEIRLAQNSKSAGAGGQE
jgi:hypothetical protein